MTVQGKVESGGEFLEFKWHGKSRGRFEQRGGRAASTDQRKHRLWERSPRLTGAATDDEARETVASVARNVRFERP